VLTSVELFAGAGGLGMGLSLAGFRHLAVVEWDRWAADTIRENTRRGHPLVSDWPLHAGDVRAFDFSSIKEPVDVVAGGPPCQPFSICGKHGGHDDARNMFPATVEVVRRLRPRAFIVENVKGLLRGSFASYFAYITLQLEFPEITRLAGEAWSDHLRRLQRQKTSGSRSGLTYNVVFQLLNAANYGVPQKRERVFVVGFRDDLDIRWNFPRETHSADALFSDQWATGDYWDRHGVSRKARPEPAAAARERVASVRQRNFRPTDERRPWRTVRDALAGLPDPERDPLAAGAIPDHRFQPGVKFYAGHTGSPLDLPAKTLKAGDHGVPGGENALVRPDGTGRYFTVRESARLQTFPDGYVFHGSWTESMRQLGNAVPVSLARAVGASVARKLTEQDVRALATQVSRSPHRSPQRAASLVGIVASGPGLGREMQATG
jgi:DNA (cytosine-5)-methyltransferase 1